MSQATNDPTGHQPRMLTLADLNELAGRLAEHADSIENLAARAMADDMRLAARLISALLRTGVVQKTDHNSGNLNRDPIRRSRSLSHAPAAAAACSSSKPSRPAASHVTGQPRLSSQSRSTPHDREHNLPHHRALSATVLGANSHSRGVPLYRPAARPPYRDED